MKTDRLLESLMEKPNIKNLGLRPEIVGSILKSYDNILINDLLSNGHVELPNGMNIEIVKLIDRVHVLRGVPYHSSRKYKLKLTMEDSLYTRIEEYYDNLMKEIN